MQLMAQHKYGLRFRNEASFQGLINNLGKAAVTIDLLEVKHTCSVKLVMSGCATGRSKGLFNFSKRFIVLKNIKF